MPKKTTKKKAVKRKPSVRGVPWHQALFLAICNTVIKPHLDAILTGDGVTSKSDLYRQFRDRIGGTISTEDFDAALNTLGYNTLFTKKRTITIQAGNTPMPNLLDATPTRDVPGQLGLNGQEIGPGNEDGLAPTTRTPDVDPTPVNELEGYVPPETRAVDDAALGLPSSSPASRAEGNRVFPLPS